MNEEPGLRELPSAVGEYAAGVADVLARGAVVVTLLFVALAALPLAIVGGGIALVVLAVVGPAVAAAIALEVPELIGSRFD